MTVAGFPVGDAVLEITEQDIARFWAKVDRTDGPDGCWIWTASVTKAGYGQLRVKGGMVYAHRLAWVLAGHELIPYLMLDHVCHVRHCVNPGHLRQVTNADNVANRAGPTSHNTSGVRGVYVQNGGRWVVSMNVRKRRYRGGSYATLEEAEIAVIRLRLEHGRATVEDVARLEELEGEVEER